MILINSNVTNNIDLYNTFKNYINTYLTYAYNEEYVCNYSYKHISVLKLYCTFNLINRIYDLSLLTDKDGNLLYTEEELINTYSIYYVAAELQKVNININDIWSMFFSSSITTDLITFKNKNQSISTIIN